LRLFSQGWLTEQVFLEGILRHKVSAAPLAFVDVVDVLGALKR
jgi:hypothetical protein